MSAIKYTRDGETMELLRPVAGRWTATVEGREVCEVEVTEGAIKEWARLCALDVAHMLPEGCAPVVREWLSSGNPALRAVAGGAARDAAQAASWAADGDAARAALLAADGDAAWAAAWARTASVEVGARQGAHLHGLIWTAHGEMLNTRARIELARDLRYHGEEEAAAAVLPAELREVTA